MPGREVFGEEELQEVSEVIKRGVLFRYGFDAQRQGIFKVKEFEGEFAQYIGAKYSLGVSSGTSALQTALLSLGLPKGSIVLTPCFTFVATIEAIEWSGYKPILCEIDESLNISTEDINKKIISKTACILPVHMMGSSCDMDNIVDISRRNNLFLVEDACQATGAEYKGKKAGTFGNFGTFSFDYVKVLTTGEGGMITTDDENLYKEADACHDHGHPHLENVPRGVETRKRKGFDFRMNEVQGALGIAQLKKIDYIIKKQRENKKAVRDILKNYEFITFRKHFDEEGEIGTFLTFFLPDKQKAEKFKEKMSENGITPGILNYWHFIANIESVQTREKFKKSREILEKTVVMEILIKMDVEKTIDGMKKVCDNF
ncbi:MAG: DegT/DnrJ/EryC1/StrS family aminotransferase [Candidatus Omnitrophica bacterium]|nr:DegT/DnrJ/EryC1/StrS family aminotransferase [Candidatus Omnitrophota bacterium]